jgi:hypothetical protein
VAPSDAVSRACELLAHIPPARTENLDFLGVIIVAVQSELGGCGWRPPRPAAVDPVTVGPPVSL